MKAAASAVAVMANVTRFEDIDNRFIKPYLTNASELVRTSGDSAISGGGGGGGGGNNGGGRTGGGKGGRGHEGGEGGGDATPARVASGEDLREIALDGGQCDTAAEPENTFDAFAPAAGFDSAPLGKEDARRECCRVFKKNPSVEMICPCDARCTPSRFV